MQASLLPSWCSSAFWMQWRRTRRPWQRNSRSLRDCWLGAVRRRLQKREQMLLLRKRMLLAAQANVTNAELLYRRQQTLAKQQYVSLQIRDDAQRSYLAEQADLAAKRQVLAAKAAGPATRRHRPAQGRHCRSPGNAQGGQSCFGSGTKGTGRYTALCSRRWRHPEPDSGARRYGHSADTGVYSRPGQSALGARLSARAGDGQSRSRHARVD